MNDANQFRGFPKQGLRFLRDLKAHNTREWFARNKHIYEESVATPAKAFAAEMKARLGQLTKSPMEANEWLQAL